MDRETDRQEAERQTGAEGQFRKQQSAELVIHEPPLPAQVQPRDGIVVNLPRRRL